LGHLLEPCREVRGVTHRGVVHTQVIANLADDDQARIDANTHLEAESTLCLEHLGHVTDSPLNAQSGMHRPAGTILVRDRRTEQGHDAITRVLVDRPLEAVHLGGNAFEAAVDEVVHDLGVKLLGE
jgi:hypothetical protein